MGAFRAALQLRKTLARPGAEWWLEEGVILGKSQAALVFYPHCPSFLCSNLTGLGCGNLNLTGGLNLPFHAKKLRKGDNESKTGNRVLLCKAVVCQHLEHCTWLEPCISRQTEQEESRRRTAVRALPQEHCCQLKGRAQGADATRCATLVLHGSEGMCRTVQACMSLHAAWNFLSPSGHCAALAFSALTGELF